MYQEMLREHPVDLEENDKRSLKKIQKTRGQLQNKHNLNKCDIYQKPISNNC